MWWFKEGWCLSYATCFLSWHLNDNVDMQSQTCRKYCYNSSLIIQMTFSVISDENVYPRGKFTSNIHFSLKSHFVTYCAVCLTNPKGWIIHVHYKMDPVKFLEFFIGISHHNSFTDNFVHLEIFFSVLKGRCFHLYHSGNNSFLLKPNIKSWPGGFQGKSKKCWK